MHLVLWDYMFANRTVKPSNHGCGSEKVPIFDRNVKLVTRADNITYLRGNVWTMCHVLGRVSTIVAGNVYPIKMAKVRLGPDSRPITSGTFSSLAWGYGPLKSIKAGQDCLLLSSSSAPFLLLSITIFQRTITNISRPSAIVQPR